MYHCILGIIFASRQRHTMCVLVTGVQTFALPILHFLADDPPEDIGWKLAAVNLSDLAAKGARPLACLMNYALQGDAAWDTAFLAGLAEALQTHGMPLIGGEIGRAHV